MAPQQALLDAELTFSSPPFSTLLDARVLRALADLKFAHPTLVQAKAIPLLLEGKDVLARARTGSGKTAAYVVPAVQRILEAKIAEEPTSPTYQVTRAVVLVPTRELAIQVTNFVKALTVYAEGVVSVVNVAAGGANIQRVLLNDNPDVVVATPTKLLALLQSKSVDLAHLAFLAIDEADLLLSYGHKDDLSRILDPAMNFVPKLGTQACLMSATLSEEINSIKGLVLRNPAILTLSEPATASSLLTQHFTHTSEGDKFLLIFVLLKLKLIKGKSIIFVNDIERGYRVRLFLEHFGIKCCVVNSELPLASRYHVVEEFNRGVYDVVIATDEANPDDVEKEAAEEEEEEQEEEEEDAEGDDEDDEAQEEADEAEETTDTNAEAGPSKRRATSPPAGAPRKKKRGPGNSMARGIDFTAASSVINFDLPTTATAYLHRVGRTARAGHSGLALSFVVPKDKWGERQGRASRPSPTQRSRSGTGGGRRGEIEGFRYRMEDALRAVTSKRVQDARREEVRRELLNSEKLKQHFAANPLDLAFLRHDAPLHAGRTSKHLKHVPGYLMPKIAALPTGGDVGDGRHIPFAKRGRGGGRGRGGRGGRGGKGRKVDPLKFKS
ncbi:hypothetical protein CcaverHIS002_0112670 [Cutaneotrichosporon cavernicola]|nr:hypothetical protein CcaverHIS002_0112670 [Cutaneotrichosporon cavernicola]